MKRICFAIGALLSAVLICTAGYFILVDTCEKLETTLDEVVYFAEKNDTENALKKAEEVAKQWEAHKITFPRYKNKKFLGGCRNGNNTV